MAKTIFFDLDGTLLSMDQEEFIGQYFGRLMPYMAQYGYDPKKMQDSIWKGTMAMYANTSDKTNEELFWDIMQGIYGPKIMEELPRFETFYRTKFQEIARVCPPNEQAVKAVKALGKEFPLVLATNPLFPDIATLSRIGWAGLEPEDFELVTTYENCSRSKPNPAYFSELLEKLNLKPEEVLMVGNDAVEDGCCRKLGIDLFLITDHLINKENLPLDDIPHGSFDDLMDYVEEWKKK